MAAYRARPGGWPRCALVLGQISEEQFHAAEEAALNDAISRLEATGSPIITDGEQTNPSFATYPLSGLENLAADGATIPFADGYTRQLPRLTRVSFPPWRPRRHLP